MPTTAPTVSPTAAPAATPITAPASPAATPTTEPISFAQYGVISSGTSHTCALQNDGTPVCWGDDTYGQASPPAG